MSWSMFSSVLWHHKVLLRIPLPVIVPQLLTILVAVLAMSKLGDFLAFFVYLL